MEVENRSIDGAQEAASEISGADGAAEDTASHEEAIKSAVAAARSEWEKELDTKIEEAKSEGERLAKMTVSQRQEEERKAEKEKFEAEKAEFEHQKLVLRTEQELTRAGLPAAIARHLAVKDENSVSGVIAELKAVFDAAVGDAVKAKLRGSAPEMSGGDQSGASSSFMDIILENQR